MKKILLSIVIALFSSNLFAALSCDAYDMLNETQVGTATVEYLEVEDQYKITFLEKTHILSRDPLSINKQENVEYVKALEEANKDPNNRYTYDLLGENFIYYPDSNIYDLAGIDYKFQNCK